MKVLIGSLIFLCTFSAHAGFLLEPGLTYEKADNTIAWPSPLTTSTGSSSGLGFNLKAGWSFGLLYLALDAGMSSPTFKNSAVDYDASASSTLYAGILGVDLPLGFRVWGGYVFDGSLDPKASNGYDVVFKKANGYKLGAGFKLIFVSFNFEYMDLQYTDSSIETLAGVSTNIDLDDNFKNKVYLFSVSVPLTF
ncbi:hypothetical protein [Bdellovibrio sp. HCB337]|uniref:hypothetical protein n=1 Tax=Bdellovibrio sp. HCB337 TaxID=3394358 RepID=UPI0039A64903